MDASAVPSPVHFTEEDFIKQLVDAGNELLEDPPVSKEELLEKLDRLELLLSNVYQVPSGSFHEALKPSIKALVADGLLRHADVEVKISITCCMSEIMRITAPDQPYDDKSIEDFFQLAIMAFRKLANMDDCCHSKAVSILETFAKYRICVLMLDLELDALTLEMFRLFLNSICPKNADDLLPYMEAIMTMIIEDSEEISLDLLNILLTSAKKENENPLLLSYVLGVKVLRNCNVKLQQYLPKAVKSLGIAINDYAEIVELTWQEAIQRENLDSKELTPNSSCPRDVDPSENELSKLLVGDNPKELLPTSACPKEVPYLDLAKMSGQDVSCNTSMHSVQVNQNATDVRNHSSHENLTITTTAQKSLDPESNQIPTRRGRKPNSLMKPEEGYDHTWISVEGKSYKTPRQRKESKKRIGHPPKHSVSKGSHFSSVMGEAEILKPTASQSLNSVDDFNTRERSAEEKNKLNDGAQLMSVSDSLRTSPCGYRSASTVKRSCSGETFKTKCKRKCSPSEEAAREQAKKLVGCRIKVWWPIDQKFYEGHIVSFDHFKKKYKVRYDDGDKENLDLSIERWELLTDINSAVDVGQETVAGLTDLSEIKLDHIINSYRSSRRKHKRDDALEHAQEMLASNKSNIYSGGNALARDAAAELPVVKHGVEKQKVARSKSTSEREKAIDVLANAATSTLPVQQLLTNEEEDKCGRNNHKISKKKKRRQTTASVPRKASPQFSVQDSEVVNVNGYQIKVSAAPILEEIFAKHGDIASNCPYPSLRFRASVFEIICDIIRQLRTNDWGTIISTVGQMKTAISDTAAASHLELSWLQKILEDIPTEDDNHLVDVITNTSLASKAAREDLTQRKAELLIAERRFEEAKRCLEHAEQSKKAAERSVEVLENVKQKVRNDMELNFKKRNVLQNRFFTLQ